MNAKTYPTYRPSGVLWLGEVPEHWGTVALRWCSVRYAGGTPDRNKDHFWDDGTIPWINSGAVNQKLITEPSALITDEGFAGSSAKWIPAGALVMALAGQGRTKGMVAQLAIQTTCNQSMAAIVPDERVSARYVFWLLDAQYEVIRNLAGGEQRDGLNLEILGGLPVLLPPLDEQRAIATFLDRETERIDALVAKKRRLIERLQEYRTALITRTVTRGLPPDAARAAGLDPSPRLNPSGVEWLSDVPEHWEVQRLRACSVIQTGPFGSQLHADEYISGGIPIINPANIVKGRVVPDDDATITPTKANELSRHAFKEGDLAFGRRGEMARVALVSPSDLPALCGTGCLRVDPSRQRVEPSFLLLALGLGALRDWLELVAVGSTLANLNEQIVGRIPVALPPPSEQRAIAAFLSDETARIDGLTAEVETAIERLQEYRSALITAAVTGKIDVRE